MFIVNGFGNWMARYIENTILVFILYNLTSYAHSRPMNCEILTFFFIVMDTWCKMKVRSIKMHAKNV